MPDLSTLLASLALLVVVALVVLWKRTSNAPLTSVDLGGPWADAASRMVARYADRLPDRALSLVLVDGDHTPSAACGKDQAGRDVDDRTLFEIGSVTKVFTGLLLAEMIVRGEVKLSTSLGETFGHEELSPSARAITLAQLATHTAGLPRLPPDLSDGEDKKNPYAHYGPARLVESLRSLDVRPSDTSDYSNYGVGLLGEALAIRSGVPFRDLLRERVLDPLGLSSAAILAEGEPKPDRLIDGFMGDEKTPHWHLAALAGAGGLCAPMGELGALLRHALHPSEEWKAAFELMWTPHHRGNGESVGLCWQIRDPDGDPIYWHNGSTFGATSFVALRPSKGRAVAAVQNRSELIQGLVGRKCAAETVGWSLISL